MNCPEPDAVPRPAIDCAELKTNQKNQRSENDAGGKISEQFIFYEFIKH